MSSIAIVDYGMGNLYSVAKAVEYVASSGDQVFITSNADELVSSDKVIFPGQGAARDCMSALNKYELTIAIHETAKEKPFLGICMGMQVLMKNSEENEGTQCLNIYDGSVEYFGKYISNNNTKQSYKIPHMGWNAISQQQSHPLWKDIPDASYFYFVHSYFVNCNNRNLIAGATEYGVQFTSVIANENVFAMQCHPEKSASVGLQLLKNFVHWDGSS